jgi:hypothetical protein
MVVVVVPPWPAPSVATTLRVLAPPTSVRLLLQPAVLLSVAEALVAPPFTVTRVTPLPPAPLSVAVPLSVMPDTFTT